MKANKAPDKIYLNPRLMEDGESIVRRCTFDRQRDSQVEYTHTDAFIEKACEAYCKVCDTQACIVMGECSWASKYKKQLLKMMKG
jgi:NADH:ubiquinone oxidoreductase subunit E